ncbi:MAG TPA: C4-dicarboxylate transporter DcuC [Abditibacteriaceae bacterium]|jgi:DcuC family C4-dicarboxylate transporter
MILFGGLVIIALAVYAVIRRVDVRLALLLAAVALGAISQTLPTITQRFFATLTDGKFVIPICSAMGFAYVLRHTQCDRHLVHLLTNPLKHGRVFLIPGAVLVAFFVNIPIISQTSTAVAVGAVLVPLLLAARVSPETTGATLLLGASIGGELLNPGAPEFRTITAEAANLGIKLDPSLCVQAMLPLLLVHVPIATGLFWLQSHKVEKLWAAQQEPTVAEKAVEDNFKINFFKALVPLVPLALLIIVGKPWELIPIPESWLVDSKDAPGTFDSRLIGAAMIVGVLCAALAAPRQAKELAGTFFEGAGYAYANVISIIVAATCFGEGVKNIGLDKVIGDFVTQQPGALLPLAGFVPLGFGFVSGSGMASTQSLAAFFIVPGQELNLSPQATGAVVALGAAAGRTMSLVAAVTLMCSQLTDTPPDRLVRRVAFPLLVGMAATVIFAMLRAQ